MGSARRRRRRRRPAKAATLGDLPDSVLGNILSFLPVKEAARTALLSSSWRHLWSVSPLNLNLRDLCDRRRGDPKLASTLSAVLSHHKSHLAGLVRISEFAIPPSDRPRLESLCEAFEGKRIQHLLHFRDCYGVDNFLPPALICGGSLLTLIMFNCRFRDPAVALQHLMNLRVLALRGLALRGDTFGEDLLSMISGLPMLLGLELEFYRVMCDFHLQSKSVQVLGISKLSSGGGVLTLDAPNLQELQLSSINIRMDLEAIVSTLPKLHYLFLHHLNISTLCIRSRSLKRLALSEIPMKPFTIDTPSLQFLRMYGVNISKEDFEKILSSLPMLQTLQLISLRHSSLFEKLRVTSESLQHLTIDVRRFGRFEEISIIDAPCLQTVLIAHDTFELSKVEVVNAPRISLGYSYSYRNDIACPWIKVSIRIQHMAGMMEL